MSKDPCTPLHTCFRSVSFKVKLTLNCPQPPNNGKTNFAEHLLCPEENASHSLDCPL